MILRLTVAVAAALMLNLPSLADTSVALEKSVSTPLAWIIHEFSDAKAPLVVERRCETSDSPARRAFA
jgi:hypothetical protein